MSEGDSHGLKPRIQQSENNDFKFEITYTRGRKKVHILCFSKSLETLDDKLML